MKRIRASFTRPFLLWSMFGTMGCDDPLSKAQIIASLRVLGARLEVRGEPNRASPLPGERVRVEFLVATKGGTPSLAWTLSACVIKPSNTGVPSCASAPFAISETPVPVSGPPVFEFDVPNHLDSTATPTLAIQGKVCEGALAVGQGLEATCTSQAPGTALSFEFPLASNAVANNNPSFAEVPILLDGAVWSPTENACDAAAIVKIAAKSGVHSVELFANASAREPLPQKIALDPPRESLLFSHFSDEVELDRVFSSIAADATETSVRVDFSAPESAPSAAFISRFWFVLRDLRGGSAFVERSVCVIP